MFVSAGTIIIDDIVTSDGRTFWNVLGGAATHAAAGMRVWSRSVGLVGAVGSDFPDEHWAALGRLGVDLRGVRRLLLPSAAPKSSGLRKATSPGSSPPSSRWQPIRRLGVST